MIKLAFQIDERRINRILDQIPVEFQRAAYEGGLVDAGKLLKSRVESEAPSSQRSGSRRKWSRKMRASRANVKPLHQSIGYKVIKPKDMRSPSVLVGPRRPEGNVANLITPGKSRSRKKVLWGRVTGQTAEKTNDFIRRAFDASKNELGNVFARGTIRAVRKRLRDLGQ